MAPIARPRRRVKGLGVDQGFDIGNDPVEEEEALSPRNSSSPERHTMRNTDRRNPGEDLQSRPRGRSLESSL